MATKVIKVAVMLSEGSRKTEAHSSEGKRSGSVQRERIMSSTHCNKEDLEGKIEEVENRGDQLEMCLSQNYRKTGVKSDQPEVDCALIELKKRFVNKQTTDQRGKTAGRRLSAQEAMGSVKTDEAEDKITRRRKKSLSVDDTMLLHWAVTHNDIETVKDLLTTRRVQLNQPGVDSFYPIHRAASTGSLECLKYLVKNGALVNVYDEDGGSPLDVAIEEGEFDCARFLIESGANFHHIQDGFMNVRHLGRMRSSTC